MTEIASLPFLETFQSMDGTARCQIEHLCHRVYGILCLYYEAQYKRYNSPIHYSITLWGQYRNQCCILFCILCFHVIYVIIQLTHSVLRNLKGVKRRKYHHHHYLPHHLLLFFYREWNQEWSEKGRQQCVSLLSSPSTFSSSSYSAVCFWCTEWMRMR